MMTEPHRPPSDVARGGFSLATLGLFVTVFAVLCAALDLGRLRERFAAANADDLVLVAALFGGAVILGGVIGLVRVFLDGFSWRMLALAPLGGALAGLAGGLVLVAPGPIWRSLVAVGLLLATVNLLRLDAE